MNPAFEEEDVLNAAVALRNILQNGFQQNPQQASQSANKLEDAQQTAKLEAQLSACRMSMLEEKRVNRALANELDQERHIARALGIDNRQLKSRNVALVEQLQHTDERLQLANQALATKNKIIAEKARMLDMLRNKLARLVEFHTNMGQVLHDSITDLPGRGLAPGPPHPTYSGAPPHQTTKAFPSMPRPCSARSDLTSLDPGGAPDSAKGPVVSPSAYSSGMLTSRSRSGHYSAGAAFTGAPSPALPTSPHGSSVADAGCRTGDPLGNPLCTAGGGSLKGEPLRPYGPLPTGAGGERGPYTADLPREREHPSHHQQQQQRVGCMARGSSGYLQEGPPPHGRPQDRDLNHHHQPNRHQQSQHRSSSSHQQPRGGDQGHGRPSPPLAMDRLGSSEGVPAGPGALLGEGSSSKDAAAAAAAAKSGPLDLRFRASSNSIASPRASHGTPGAVAGVEGQLLAGGGPQPPPRSNGLLGKRARPISASASGGELPYHQHGPAGLGPGGGAGSMGRPAIFSGSSSSSLNQQQHPGAKEEGGPVTVGQRLREERLGLEGMRPGGELQEGLEEGRPAGSSRDGRPGREGSEGPDGGYLGSQGSEEERKSAKDRSMAGAVGGSDGPGAPALKKQRGSSGGAAGDEAGQGSNQAVASLLHLAHVAAQEQEQQQQRRSSGSGSWGGRDREREREGPVSEGYSPQGLIKVPGDPSSSGHMPPGSKEGVYEARKGVSGHPSSGELPCSYRSHAHDLPPGPIQQHQLPQGGPMQQHMAGLGLPEAYDDSFERERGRDGRFVSSKFAWPVSVPTVSRDSRARKPSWFQTEIMEKIPVHVQQSCQREWGMMGSVRVVCGELLGTFFVNSAGEFHIRMEANQEVVSPNKFEELAGKKTARNWQQSIRLSDYTMTGEHGSALLKLGHFTRIVGLVLDAK